MKIVTGIFTPEDAVATIDYLTANGFSQEEVLLISSNSEMPAYLEGEAEESAVAGAVVGGVAGGALAGLGSWVSSTIPGFEYMMMTGVMTTAIGVVAGAYFCGAILAQ